ncbi:hypothetical protein OIU78_003212 [Salix suchowensis]|nr:hypothetical protein OIU78_003212 [Salix suchowensis]
MEGLIPIVYRAIIQYRNGKEPGPLGIVVQRVTFSFVHAAPWRFRQVFKVRYTSFRIRLWLLHLFNILVEYEFFYHSNHCFYWNSIVSP